MAFKEVNSLDADTTISLGGTNKKTGKANPTKVEGYYLGSRTVPSPMSKTGTAFVHVFQTASGNTGVWGKTDLDRKMQAATPGAMTRVTQNGLAPAKPGKQAMYKFKVEIDEENTIEVAGFPNNEDTADGSTEPSFDEVGETGLDDEDEALDEVQPVRTAPRPTANSVDAARQAKVAALLAGKGKAKSA